MKGISSVRFPYTCINSIKIHLTEAELVQQDATELNVQLDKPLQELKEPLNSQLQLWRTLLIITPTNKLT